MEDRGFRVIGPGLTKQKIRSKQDIICKKGIAMLLSIKSLINTVIHNNNVHLLPGIFLLLFTLFPHVAWVYKTFTVEIVPPFYEKKEVGK